MFKKAKQLISRAADRLSLAGDSVIYALLGIMVVVGPVFFIPTRLFPASASKGYFFLFVGIAILIVYAVRALRKGELSVPRSLALGMLGIVTIASLIGTIFAPSFAASFFGYGFETVTWVFFALFSVIALVSFQTVRTLDRAGALLAGIFIAFFVLAVWHIIRFFFGADVMALGTLLSSTSSMIGSWGDLAAFFGLVALLAAFTLEMAPFHKGIKIAVGILGGLAMVFLMLMSNKTVITTVGFVALLSSLYLFSFAYWDRTAQSYRKNRRTPWYMMGIFVLALGGIFFGSVMTSAVSKHQVVATNDIRPSMKATLQVASKSLVKNFATGFGPNTFSYGWNQVKPLSISGTDVGSADFSLGSGYVPTLIASNGIAGAVAWILFFAFLVVALVKGLSRGFENGIERYVTVTVGMIVVYLGAIMWIYVPGSYLLLMFALFAGSYLSLAHIQPAESNRVFSFIKDPRASFFGILGVTSVLVLALIGAYIGGRKASSFVHYARAATFLAASDATRGGVELARAANLAGHDIYHSKLAQLSLANVGAAVSQSTVATKDATSKRVEQLLGTAIAHAQAAIAYNPSDYKNYALLGSIYQSMVTFGVKDAGARAEAAYAEAEKRNPKDSTMKLLYTNLAMAEKNTDKALAFIAQSIALYPTKNAHLMRARIEIEQKKWSAAAASLKQVMAYDRSNVLAYINLGVVSELAGDTQTANSIFDTIRSRFTDGDKVIEQVRKSFAGLETEPVITPVLPDETPVVAPTPKKQ